MAARQSLRAVLLRGDAFSARLATGFEQYAAISHTHRRIRMRVDLEVHGDGAIGHGCVEKSDLERVTVDTTVQEKAVT